MSRFEELDALKKGGLKGTADIETQVPTIGSLLATAVEISGFDERQRFVDQSCRGDAALKQRLQELIDNHFRAGSFLEAPAAGFAASIDVPISNAGPGTVVGHYKLLQQIGEGGMGTVYMAEQMRPVQRKVALKLMKLSLDGRQVLARFEAERQALALMDHPNIAKVLDAGTTSGEAGADWPAVLRDGSRQGGSHHPLLR